MKCPACGHDLQLMHTDPDKSSMLWHCEECLRDWEVYIWNGEAFMRMKFWG